MENVKQYLYDALVEEFNVKPSFVLARTLYLFCHFNPAFDMPGNVKKTFIDGLLENEVRAFSLRYPMKKRGNGGLQSGRGNGGKAEAGSLDEMKNDIYREIAAEDLSKGTGKTYSPGMVKKITAKFRGVLTYNDILEIFIMKGHPMDQ
ncbi:MAG: hypothetical protein M8357_05130 [Desulfobulbaceae bacterium]|nr:hypothetical protein [Desulfobulbaceae bacterium]